MANESVNIRTIEPIEDYILLSGDIIENFIVMCDIWDDKDRCCSFISVVEVIDKTKTNIKTDCIYTAQHTAICNLTDSDINIKKLIADATKEYLTKQD